MDLCVKYRVVVIYGLRRVLELQKSTTPKIKRKSRLERFMIQWIFIIKVTCAEGCCAWDLAAGRVLIFANFDFVLLCSFFVGGFADKLLNKNYEFFFTHVYVIITFAGSLRVSNELKNNFDTPSSKSISPCCINSSAKLVSHSTKTIHHYRCILYGVSKNLARIIWTGQSEYSLLYQITNSSIVIGQLKLCEPTIFYPDLMFSLRTHFRSCFLERGKPFRARLVRRRFATIPLPHPGCSQCMAHWLSTKSCPSCRRRHWRRYKCRFPHLRKSTRRVQECLRR